MKKDITYDELLAKIPNKYILTIIAGERARERAKERMERGGEPLPLTKYMMENMSRAGYDIATLKNHNYNDAKLQLPDVLSIMLLLSL